MSPAEMPTVLVDIVWVEDQGVVIAFFQEVVDASTSAADCSLKENARNPQS